MGWLRYWLGFFVLAQGAAAGLLIAWIIGRFGPVKGGPPHPGFGAAAACAALWFAAFQAGLALGIGLAQPWFEPLGWLGRIWDGKSSEFVFGVAASGGVHRGFAQGARGWFWLVLSLVDWSIMYFFLLAMPWGRSHNSAADSGGPGQEPAQGESPC